MCFSHIKLHVAAVCYELGLGGLPINLKEAQASHQRAILAGDALITSLSNAVAASGSEHATSGFFARLHFLYPHQRLTPGFYDAGRNHRAPLSEREVIVIDESDQALMQALANAQSKLLPLAGKRYVRLSSVKTALYDYSIMRRTRASRAHLSVGCIRGGCVWRR